MQSDELLTVARTLTSNEQEEMRQALGLDRPTPRINDAIWLLIVGGIVLAMLAVTGAMIGLFTAANSEVLLAVFTASIGFLAGLIAPSPVAR